MNTALQSVIPDGENAGSPAEPGEAFNFGWDWDRHWDLGIGVLDHQHQQVLNYINDIRTALAHRDRLQCHALVEELLALVREHFRTEEQLMELCGYPGLDAHRQLHQDFFERLTTYHEAMVQGAETTREALRDTKLFLTTHMVEEDQKFAPYLKYHLGDGLFERVWNRLIR